MSGFVERGGVWVAIQVGLLVAIVLAGRLELAPFTSRAGLARVLIAAALVLGAAAALSLGRNLTPYPKPVAAGTMIVRGPYRVVRHPIYTAVIVGMLGVAVRAGDWVSVGLALLLLPFFYAKSTYEEQHLLDHYPGYADYQQRVPRRLVPGLL
ncbi:MAG: methyltransferase family protein [Acidimicrobiia bacterium]